MSSFVPLRQTNGEPVLFLDLSYYVFYRYYALVNWFKLSQKDTPFSAEDLPTNELFLTKFAKMFHENLTKLSKKYSVPMERVYLAADSRLPSWRKQLFPEYKANRCPRDYNSYIFDYTFQNLVENYQVMTAENVEADDIIGYLKMKLRVRYPNQKVFIVTGDHDYLQLVDENTQVFDLKGTNLGEKKSAGSAQIDLCLKVLLGDSSDNIPGVKVGSKKKALTLAQDPEALEATLKKDPELRRNYERNLDLVDMSRLPPKIIEKIDPFF
jgi:5'-3' exonuclease